MNSKKLSEKTFSALLWSAADRIFLTCFVFIIGIILARLLSPEDFGIIGLVSFFILLSRQFIDGGFTQAIIRKDVAEQSDFSTIFIFNILIGFLVYIILFLSSEHIAILFDEPILEDVIKVIGFIVIIDSLGVVQQAKLTRQIDFKSQTKISMVSSLLSSILGVWLAYNSFGLWSLVYMQLCNRILMNILLWYFTKWIPSLEFNLTSFKEMFSFGYKLLISSLIYTTNKNVHILLIGKYFSTADLGYYNRAEKFNQAPSEGISAVIERVTYPSLSSIKDNKHKLSRTYRRIVKSTMFITFAAMITLAAISDNLIVSLIGAKWIPVISYLQLLCFLGMLVPLHVINLNLLKVEGRSDIFLYLEIIKVALSIPAFLVCIYIGIEEFIIALIITSFLAFLLNSHLSGKLINYSSLNQLKDISPSFIVSLTIGFLVFVFGDYLAASFSFQAQIILFFQMILSVILFIVINELVKLDDYLYIKTKVTNILIGV